MGARRRRPYRLGVGRHRRHGRPATGGGARIPTRIHMQKYEQTRTQIHTNTHIRTQRRTRRIQGRTTAHIYARLPYTLSVTPSEPAEQRYHHHGEAAAPGRRDDPVLLWWWSHRGRARSQQTVRSHTHQEEYR